MLKIQDFCGINSNFYKREEDPRPKEDVAKYKENSEECKIWFKAGMSVTYTNKDNSC